MKSRIGRVGAALSLAIAAGLMGGCGGVSNLTRERVARSETSVQQAQQTVGNSETGALQLQHGKDHLDQARRALKDGNEQQAQRHAQLAELDAQLAVAKSDSAKARKAADEMLAGIKTLREETERSSGASQTSSDVDTSSTPPQ